MRNAVCLTLLGILCSPLAAQAQSVASAEIAALRAEISALTARLDRLEQATSAGAPVRPAAAPVAGASIAVAENPSPPAAASLKFAGDLRYRHEAINEELSPERERQRIRARFGVTADVTTNLRVGLTLATGNDDPVSANQTLDGGFARKTFGVDRAYFAWAATNDLSFTGGKIAIPFFRPGNHHLIYDSDLNPEGLALRYDRGNWFANYAGLWVEERGNADDSILLGGQLGYRAALGDGRRLTVGLSYYDYLETRSQTPFWDGAAAGNRLNGAGGYLNDFNDAELFAELGLRVGGRPLSIFADYVTNTEVDDQEAGYALGAAYGEVTRPGTWRIGYVYQRLEADAVIGAFTDSDWAGGGTDGEGHVVDFAYGLRPRVTLGFKYFINDRGMAAGSERDYNRLQADVSFAY
jgi:hypothetical protein